LNQEFGLRDFVAKIRKRAHVVAVFALVGLFSSITLLYALPRQYESKVLIMLQTPENMLSSSRDQQIMAYLQPPDESIVLSETEVLRSRDIAEMVVDDLKLTDNPEFWKRFRSKPSDENEARDDAVYYLAKRLDIRPVGRSLVIEVALRHPNAKLSTEIVNRLAQIYQEQQIRQKIEGAQKTASVLNERLKVLSEKLRLSAQAVEDYRTKEDLIDGTRVELTSQQISDISSQMMIAQADVAAVEAKNEQLQETLNNKKSLDGISQISRSNLIGLLKRDEAMLMSRYAEAQSRYGANHPRILSLRAELAELRYKKDEEVARIAESMSNDVLAARARVGALQKNLDALEQKRRRENAAAIGLRELEREADANKSIYETFLSKYKEASILGDVQKPDAKIISTARVPSLPAGPPRIVLVLLATMAGFCFGVFTALLLDQLEGEAAGDELPHYLKVAE
jgi:succinoglycan biosynthesis transport protein ExoP